MKKIINSFGISFLFLSLIGLAGCSNLSSFCHIPNQQVEQNYPVPAFNQLTIVGPANVVINQGKEALIKVVGSSNTLSQYEIQNCSHGLFITVPSKEPYTSTIYITKSFLKQLRVGPGVFLQAQKFEVLDLQVAGAGSLDTNLNGQIIASQVNISQKGSGKVSICWLASDRITVHGAGKGVILLAGQSYRLLASLTDAVNLDAKALRTNLVDIRSQNLARAEVLPLDVLQACTVDQSAVSYYQRPLKMNIDSQDSSNVLFIK